MTKLNKILLLLVSGLICLGMLLVLTASGTYSELKFNDFYHMFNSHIVRVVLAVGALLFFSCYPYDKYRHLSKKALMFVTALLFITFLMAARVKGAGRWLSFYIFTVQPSEMAKIVLIIHLAILIETKGELIKSFNDGYKFVIIWVFVISGLVLVQPNVSNSIIIFATSMVLIFIGGARMKHILGTFAVAGIGGGCAMMLFHHSRQRIMTFLSSHQTGGEINIQVHQAKIALGSGGWIGLGLGHSRQSDLFLPEAYGDFIFSILGEETGYIGALFVLGIYLAIFIIGLLIAKRAKDQFGGLLAFGLAFNIVLGAFINASVVTGLGPTTGITLPFISYGGTSIMFMCASIGIIINVGRQSRLTESIRLAKA